MIAHLGRQSLVNVGAALHVEATGYRLLRCVGHRRHGVLARVLIRLGLRGLHDIFVTGRIRSQLLVQAIRSLIIQHRIQAASAHVAHHLGLSKQLSVSVHRGASSARSRVAAAFVINVVLAEGSTGCRLQSGL